MQLFSMPIARLFDVYAELMEKWGANSLKKRPGDDVYHGFQLPRRQVIPVVRSLAGNEGGDKVKRRGGTPCSLFFRPIALGLVALGRGPLGLAASFEKVSCTSNS